jgi:hydroxymethylglutaryl-CoA lyase
MREGIDVEVCEVGLRDGLQSLKTFFPTEGKLAWIESEAAAGVPEIEVCSFVPTKVSIQFTDCEQTVAKGLAQPGLKVSALIPNLKGAEKGFALGVHAMNYVTSVSVGHNVANVRRTPTESLEAFARIAEMRDSRPEWKKVQLLGAMATSFGCTIEGAVDPKAVMKMAEDYLKAGADELAAADTVGYANPAQVKALFTDLVKLAGDVPVRAHFHDTRGLGLANVTAALEAGVRCFDASLAGLGGCMYAPGATGNIVMDDLVFMLEAMGLKTGVDIDRLLETRDILRANLAAEPMYGQLAKAGLPKGFEIAA